MVKSTSKPHKNYSLSMIGISWTTALLGCFAIAIGLCTSALANPRQDWRVLALRVSFPREQTDNPTTTGDGTFDLRREEHPTDYAGYTRPYDIPPHNLQYFQSHLEALASYYYRVSEGRIRITYDVFPKGPDSSYVLPRRMAEYGRERTTEGLSEMLCTLFREGIQRADSQEDALDFGAYDCFMLFHAGIGRESMESQPNDIWSAYLYPKDLDTYSGGPILVDEGRHQVKEGMILPEAISFMGTGGLNGLLAKLFGHQLGLPGFSNYQEGLPAAGGWCLMDTGDANEGAGTIGFIPCHPMIWSKIELGWVTPVVVTHDTTLQIVATHVRGTTLPKGIKIPISGDEYYLLENRQAHHKGDEFPEGATFSIDGTAGVCLSVEHYDAFIPGSGILIWHVNDAIIREKRADGAINNDLLHRGLFLEEADGYQDIGNKYAPSDRYEQRYGSQTDPFYQGHVSAFAGGKSELDAETGITVVVESPAQDTMTVRISFVRNEPGWPVQTDGSFTLNSPTLSPDGLRIFALSDDGSLFVWDSSGPTADTSGAGDMELLDRHLQTAYGDLDLDGRQDSVSVRGNTLWTNDRAVALQDENHTSPVLGDIDHDGYLEIVFCGKGKVYAYAFNGLPAPDFPATLPLKDSVGTISSAPILADLDGDDILEIVFGTRENGICAVDGKGRTVGGFPLPTIGAVKTSPLFSDLDKDGSLELTALTDSGCVHRWDLEKLSFTSGMDEVVWGEFGQDSQNTCAFPNSLLAPAPYGPREKVLYADRAYCYPNPIHGSQATFRFYLGRQAPVHIGIYNGAGELVDELRTEETKAQIENEVPWDTRDHASGLYLGRIEAAKEVVWVKMAVSR